MLTARTNKNMTSLDVDSLNVTLDSEAHGLKTRPMFKKYSSVTPRPLAMKKPSGKSTANKFRLGIMSLYEMHNKNQLDT